MALYLVRCNRVIQAAGLQRNVSNRIFQSKKHSVSASAASRSFHRILTNDLGDSYLKVNYPGTRRTFHSSLLLCKKFKESEYETVRVVDPSGQFLGNAEMLVLEKFCHRYHRFTFQELKADNKDYSENAVGDGNLRVFQLLDKRKEKPADSKETKTKLIKFRKDSVTEKMSKVLEILVDKGKVNITFEKQGNHASVDVMKMLQELKNVNIVTSPDKTVLLVSLSALDFGMLQVLFEDIQKQEADHIAKVKEMLKTMEGQ